MCDSFTIPKIEYLVLEVRKLRVAKLTRSVKKSELLRTGFQGISRLLKCCLRERD